MPTSNVDPRLNAMNIQISGTTDEDKLAHLFGYVIDNVNARMVSSVFKHNALSGNPRSGTVEAKRFENSVSKEYGTARTAGKGEVVKAKTIIVPVDIKREIVEEFESYDLQTYGYVGLVQRRVANHVLSMVRELDTAFFAEAIKGAKENKTAVESVRSLITEVTKQVRTTKNEFVDGVPSELIGVVVSPEIADQLREEIDILPAQDNVIANGFLTKVRGYNIYESNHLPEGVTAIAMLYSAVAQPVFANSYKPGRIPLTDAYAAPLFFYYGTKSVTPDLVAFSKVVPAPKAPATGE